jgi:ribonuclease HI
MSETPLYTIHTDGAARGNPGPAAFAYVITRDGAIVAEESACLGRTTNNVAEYTALVQALTRAAKIGARQLRIHSDSELMVKQMNGQYQVKNEDLRVLFAEAKRLCKQFDEVAIVHVRRGENSHADRLCNEALDGARRTPAPSPAEKRRPTTAEREDAIRAEAVACLRAAATAWAGGQPGPPSPEQVWDQLWSILEEQGIVRRPRAQ